MPVKTAALAIVCAACIAVPHLCRADDFETQQHDIQNTGRSTSGLDPTSLTQTWSAPGFGSPLIVGNSVLAVSSTSLDSFNIANGQVNWNVSSSGFPFSYGGGMVVQSYDVESGGNITTHLRISNASTGASMYTLAVPGDERPTINLTTDPTTGQQDAYVCDGAGTVSAYRLGTTSATQLWSVVVPDGAGAGSILGNYLLLASVDHYDALNLTTGALTKIVNGNLDGGASYLSVVDTTRSQFYVNSNGTITAYSLTGSTFKKLWSKTEAGIGSGPLALDAAGNLYCNDTSKLLELDPTTGATIRSVAGVFSNGTTPIVTSNALWDFDPALDGNLNPAIEAYSLATFQLEAQYTEVANASASTYDGDSALDDTHFVYDEGTGAGIVVSTGVGVPEPAGALGVGVGSLLLFRRRSYRTAR